MFQKLRTHGLAAATMALVAALPAAASETNVTIVVRVDNLMSVPAEWLQEAEKEASQAYDAIGVSLVWLNDSAAKLERASVDHMFKVVLGRSIRMRRAPRSALGFAPHHTNRVYIFGDCIARLAAGRRDFQAILGRVLAHEPGHHLLPGQGHSNKRHCANAGGFRSANEVGFSDEQRESIQGRLASN